MSAFNNFPTAYPTMPDQYNYQSQQTVPYYNPQARLYPQQFYQSPQVAQNNNVNTQQSPVNNSGIIWVQGESGAKSYIVPPNTTVPLWDSENQVIYIKSVDATGKPSMTILDYVDRDATQNDKKETIVPDYATKSELEDLYKQVSELTDKLNNYMQRNNNRKETRNNGKSTV